MPAVGAEATTLADPIRRIARTMPLSRRRFLAVGALAPLAGCTMGAQWRPITLDAEPQTLAGAPGGPLIGLAGPGLLGPGGPVPVRPTTDYGREARWVSVATDGRRIVGVGQTHGGAHGNARWSVFSGTAAAVTEQEQPFEVFHGYGAGQLVAAAFASGEPMLIGSWQSAAAGLDVAVWVLDGDRWRRQPSAGTALVATTRSLPQAHAAASGGRVMVVGQAIELSPLRTRAVAWTSTGPHTGWVRIDLPGAGTTTVAEAVAADSDGWLVAGRSDDRLASWRIASDLTVSTVTVPLLPAGSGVRVAVAEGGESLIVAGDGAAVRALRGRPGNWGQSVPPGASPLAADWASEPMLITAADGRPAGLFALS